MRSGIEAKYLCLSSAIEIAGNKFPIPISVLEVLKRFRRQEPVSGLEADMALSIIEALLRKQATLRYLEYLEARSKIVGGDDDRQEETEPEAS